MTEIKGTISSSQKLTGNINYQNVGGTSYDDTEIRQKIESLENNKADKTEIPNTSNFIEDANYVHTDNNFTNEEKTKLANLDNYNDTEIKEEIAENTNARHTHTNKEILDNTTASYTQEEKEKLSNLESDEWEHINTIKVEENSGFVSCNLDKNGNSFAYKEIKIFASSVLGTNTANFGLNLYNHKTTENSGTRLFTGILLANPMSNVTPKNFFLEATRKTKNKTLWIEACYRNQSGYTVTTNKTLSTINLTDDTIRKIQIYFSLSNVCSGGTFVFYGRKKVS